MNYYRVKPISNLSNSRDFYKGRKYGREVLEKIKEIESNRVDRKAFKTILWCVVEYNDDFKGFLITDIRRDLLNKRLLLYHYIGCHAADVIECLTPLAKQAYELYGATSLKVPDYVLDGPKKFLEETGVIYDPSRLHLVDNNLRLKGFALEDKLHIKNFNRFAA